MSATELAEMGFCEKRVLLAHLHGQRLTPKQRRDAERGRRAHERYYREGVAAASAAGDRRCFVATRLFGDGAWQTIVLRRYRDDVLLRRRLGRWLVASYYQLAPLVCRVLDGLPLLQATARAVVGALAHVARRRVGG